MARFVYTRTALIASLAGVVALVWIAPRLSARSTDFDRELRQLTTDLTALGPATTADAATARAFQLYHRASLTGRPDDFNETGDAVTNALARGGSPVDLLLLKATLDFRGHQLAATRQDLASIPNGARIAEVQAMVADVALQDGMYDEARAGYESVVRRQPTWGALVRLAYLTAARGDTDGGDRLYAQAEDDLTAKEMRAYAWVEVQRGWWQFNRGRYDAAASHYQQAGRAYSGYWLVDEYTAELFGAERKFDDAIALYERAIAHAPRPDLYQQLGDLCLIARRPRDAAHWHDLALAGYLESARRGEPQFFHHLATFYADVAANGTEAVTWARKDLELRHGYAGNDMLAWALYRAGQTAEALDASHRALASGMIDAHLYYHAATIARAAGRSDEAQRLFARLNDVNPRYEDFHAHR